jgi:hypothetical protein
LKQSLKNHALSWLQQNTDPVQVGPKKPNMIFAIAVSSQRIKNKDAKIP